MRLEIDLKNNAFGAGGTGLMMGLLLVFCLFFGCSRPELALSGTFVNQAASEFSIASDTLTVREVSGVDYLVNRSTGIQLLDESGKVTRRLLEREVWKAVYDADAEVLVEQKRGRRMKYTADGLMLEQSRYRRVAIK